MNIRIKNFSIPVHAWSAAAAGLITAILSSTGLCAVPDSVLADSSAVGSALPVGNTFPDTSQLLLRTSGALLLIVVLIFAVVFVLRRYVFSRNGSGPGSGEVRVLNSTFLGPKKSIHLVKVLNRILVLGVSDTQIATLSEFKAEEAEEFLVQDVSGRKEQSFAGILQTLTGRGKG